MRALIALTVVLLAVGMSAPWWGGREASGASRVPVVAVRPYSTLDPRQASSLDEFRLLAALCEPLVHLDPATLAVRPGLATAWEVSSDARTWTFHLADTRWSDGSPVTAAQMAAGLERHRSGSAHGGLVSAITGLTTPDARTLVLTCRNPSPGLGLILATPVLVPFHPSHDGIGAWADPTRVVGNGPLRCRGWQAREHLDLVPAPTYGGNAPAVGPLRLRIIDDQGTALRLYLDGAVDAVLSLGWDSIVDLRRNATPGLRSSPSWGTEVIRLRCAGGNALPLAVRQRLSAAIDRQALVRDVMPGAGEPASGVVPAVAARSGYPGAHGPAPATASMVMPALELLVPAGQAERQRVAEWLADHWQRTLGARVTVTSLPSNQLTTRVRAGDYQLARGSIVADWADPAYVLGCFRSDAGMNRTGWSDPAYDALLDAAEGDPAHRLELLARAEQRLLDQAPVIPLHHYQCCLLVRPTLGGIDANPLEQVEFARIGWQQPLAAAAP